MSKQNDASDNVKEQRPAREKAAVRAVDVGPIENPGKLFQTGEKSDTTKTSTDGQKTPATETQQLKPAGDSEGPSRKNDTSARGGTEQDIHGKAQGKDKTTAPHAGDDSTLHRGTQSTESMALASGLRQVDRSEGQMDGRKLAQGLMGALRNGPDAFSAEAQRFHARLSKLPTAEREQVVQSTFAQLQKELKASLGGSDAKASTMMTDARGWFGEFTKNASWIPPVSPTHPGRKPGDRNPYDPKNQPEDTQPRPGYDDKGNPQDKVDIDWKTVGQILLVVGVVAGVAIAITQPQFAPALIPFIRVAACAI